MFAEHGILSVRRGKWENEINPDHNVLNKMESNCCYYSEQQLNESIMFMEFHS